VASGRPKAEMPEELVRYLEGGRLVVAATVDVDAEGAPYTMVMNSALALDAHTIRFALDHRTHTLTNLRADPRIMLEVVADGMIYGVRGVAAIVRETMDHAPIASALVEMAVEHVKRDLPPGVIVEGPVFRWGALEPYIAPVEPPMFEELRTYQRGG
jgi:predicted pyridoxine 5'-phosphate oxidase superfamily flavin-nucleotide-binding protein